MDTRKVSICLTRIHAEFYPLFTNNRHDINRGVDRITAEADFETKANDQGAGDQGMMFGYATNETRRITCRWHSIYRTLNYYIELAEFKKRK